VVTHNCKIGMGYHYRARYECILFFEKGKRKLNDLGIADILEHPRINGGYPAEKPPQVSSVLVRQSTEPGELVVDPFMGSGSSGVAAVTQGRSFAGNDLCEEAVQISRRRLLEAGAKEPLRALASDAAQPQLGFHIG
jgi:site-specific DNA-methyltransferase (adenine-specific)